jgi:hypothetical protein
MGMETKEQTLDELATHAHMALKRCKQAREEWIEGTLELAAVLGKARAQFRDNVDFGNWIENNGLGEINKNDRAALIAMSSDLELARRVLEHHNSRSWQLVREAFKISESSYPRNTTSEREPEDKILTFPVKTLTETAPAPNAGVQIIPIHRVEASADPKDQVQVVPVVRSQPITRNEDLIGLFEEKGARALMRELMAKSSFRELAAIMIRAVKEGFLVKNSFAIRTASLRLIFPHCTPGGSGGTAAARFAVSFDLSKPAERKRFEADVWPAVMANKQAFLADQTQLERIVTSFVNQRNRENLRRIKEGKIEIVAKTLPTSESQVMMFGEYLWPRVDERFGTYNYAELKTAIATFRDMWRWMWRESPASRAIQIRQSTRWYTEHADMIGLEPGHSMRKVWRLIHALARLGEINPDGEEKLPE